MRWLRHNLKAQRAYVVGGCYDVIERKTWPLFDVPLYHFLCKVADSTICDQRCQCLGRDEFDEDQITHVLCKNENLTHPPRILPPSATIIHLQNNDISILDFTKHKHIMHTKTMYLQNSNIREINATAYRTQPDDLRQSCSQRWSRASIC